MMRNKVYETLPSTYGTHNTVPTLLGNNGTSAGNYMNDHPMDSLRKSVAAEPIGIAPRATASSA